MTLASRPARPAAARAAGDGADDDAVSERRHEFDLAQSEAAELQRELEALDAMLMAELKNEDEILKKWIALI